MLDDVEACVEVLNMILTRRSMPAISSRRYREVFDFPVVDFYRRIGFDFSAESFDDVAVEYIAEYNKKRFECSLHKGAVEVLNAYIESGLTQSILSAYQQKMLAEAVEYFGISGLFSDMVGLDDYYAACKIDNGKRLIEGLEVDKPEVLLVGDTTHDFDVAGAMGVDCVLITGGHQSEEKLKNRTENVLDSIERVLTL